MDGGDRLCVKGGEFEPGDFQVRLQVAFHPLAVDPLQVPGRAARLAGDRGEGDFLLNV